MAFKFVSYILFAAVFQAYPTLSQQLQGGTVTPAPSPAPGLFPGVWNTRPFYAAAAEAWRDYFIRAQQATNQIYQQWANLTASNPFGGIYGGANQPARPGRPGFQGIFGQSGDGGAFGFGAFFPTTPRPEAPTPAAAIPEKSKPIVQAAPQENQARSPIVTPPTVQPPKAVIQPQPAPIQPQVPVVQHPVVQQPAQVVQQPAPIPQTQDIVLPSQIPQQSPGAQVIPRPIAQALGQVPNNVGLFGGRNPVQWVG